MGSSPTPVILVVVAVITLAGIVSAVLTVTSSFRGFNTQQGDNRLVDAKEDIDEFCENSYADSITVRIEPPRNGEIVIRNSNEPEIIGETTSEGGEVTELGPEELNCEEIRFQRERYSIPTEDRYNLTKLEETEGISISVAE